MTMKFFSSTEARTYDQGVPSLDDELAESRCDRCVAEARVLITRPGVGQLALCGNHWHRHEEQLTKEGWSVSASSLDKLTAS
jgi:hypothetical protein